MKGYERDKICIDYPIKKRRNITMKWGLNTLLSTGVTIWRPTPFGTLLLPAINSCWKWGYSEVAEQMEGPVCTMLIRLWQVNRVEVAVPTWAVGSSADWWISGDGADKGFELNMFLNISFCFHPFSPFSPFLRYNIDSPPYEARCSLTLRRSQQFCVFQRDDQRHWKGGEGVRKFHDFPGLRHDMWESKWLVPQKWMIWIMDDC